MPQNFQLDIHIHYAALEVIIKHADAATGGTLGSLHTASVAKLSELIDIMMLLSVLFGSGCFKGESHFRP